MSTPEERLAALLRQEAETVHPAGDGLRRIQRRVAARRRTRWFLLPSTALVTAAAVGGFFLLGGSSPRTTLDVTGDPSTTPTAEPTAQAPGPAFVPAIWPFASKAQADAWRADPSSKPWAGSNLGVAQHFVDDYLRLDGVHLVQTCVSCDVVDVLSAEDAKVGTVTLVREDDAQPRAYSVASVSFGEGFGLAEPLGALSSPAAVGGTITGVDENVRVELLTQAGKRIARATTPAGTGDWTALLGWTDQEWFTGALVATTYSAKDGSLNRIAVERVTRSTTPGPTAEVVCGGTTLQLGKLDLGGYGTGDISFGFGIVNLGESPCTLNGYADVVFKDSNGETVPFDLRRGSSQGIQDQGPADVVLGAGGWATVGIGQFRCDETPSAVAVSYDVTLPGLRTVTLGPVGNRLGTPFCNRSLTMTAVRPAYR